MREIDLAVIGGSGLYNMAELTDVEERGISTPFGDPSDKLTIGSLHGQRVAFLPRHGRGHLYMPTDVPYRANIYALKSLGVKYIISVSACGSLQADFAPGDILIPDQLYDNTKNRTSSFFSKGMVAHVGMAEPFSPELNDALAKAVKAADGVCHQGGSFITIEGPRFSTKGESNLFRQWGMSIIGMTTSPEAFLAREAEIAYSVMAHITDYDVWHESEEPVTVEMVVQTVKQNTKVAQAAISYMAKSMADWAGEMAAHHALAGAVMTAPGQIDPELQDRLGLLTRKYLA